MIRSISPIGVSVISSAVPIIVPTIDPSRQTKRRIPHVGWRKAATSMLIFVLLEGISAFGQRPPICDVNCGPDPGSGSYLSNVGARVKRHNARGNSNPMVARQGIMTSDLLGTSQNLPGSQSFNWSTPLVNLPGRAGLDVNLTLNYNSRVWDINTADGDITFNIDRDFPSYGFRLDYGYLENDVTDGFWILTEGDGSKHQLNSTATNLWDSIDSTFIELNSNTMVVSYRDGRQISYQLFPNLPNGSDPLYRPVQITDTNGNYTSIGYVASSDAVASQHINAITDTLGRVINFNYNSSGQLFSITQGTAPNIFTYATFTWGTVTLNYNFRGLAVTDTQASGTLINVLTQCTLPNGTYYTFSYGDWGIINRIDYFSNNGTRRSYESYNYPNAATALTDVPMYTQQTVSPDGTTQYAWTYSTTKSGDIVSAQTITDPSTTTTTINLNNTDPCSGTVTSFVVKSGSTTLRTVNNTWTGDSSGNNCQITSAKTTLNDSGQQFTNTYAYDSNGNVTDEVDKNFDGTVLQELITTYQAPTANHILSLISSVVVKDAAGAKRSRTDFAYDITTLTTISNAVHNTGSSPTRGNLTSIIRYTNAQAGTGAITRTMNYDSLGNLILAQLDCCNQKTWTYSGTTQYAYPDSITRGVSPLTLTTGTTYDFASGLVLTSTDENNQTAQFQYDSTRRLISAALPNGTILYTDYDDASASTAVTSRNNVNNLREVTITDGLNRTIRQQTKNGQTTVVSTTDTSYDGLSHPTSASNPYAPGDTVLYTITTYDALGRPIQLSPPSGSSYQYSYSGNAITIADPTGKQIRRINDSLNRLMEIDEPTLSSSLTINGSDQFIAGINAAPGSGTVTINGGEQWQSGGTYCAEYNINGDCVDWEFNPPIYDAGTVTITVNGFAKSVGYGQGDTTSTAASNIAAAFNGDGSSPVNASASNNVVTLTAKTTGSATNYALSTSVSYDSADFSNASFSATASGATLTGGANGQNAIYDSGTVTAAVNGFSKSVSFGQNSTTSTIASALAAAFNGDTNSPVMANAIGNVITFDATTFNRNSESLSASATYDSTHFSAASFTTSTTGSLSGNLAVASVTQYSYRPTGELTSASSGAETRAYTYDDLGRLTSTTLPESGTTQYTYFDFGGVQSRTDARGVVTNYTYDGLNQLQQVSYVVGSTGVPSPGNTTFSYGTAPASYNNGRLIQMTDGTGSESYSYDLMGNATQLTKVINGNSFTLNYGHDGLSALTQMTYPSGRVVGQNYDGIGRLQSITNAGANALTVNSYNAAGQVMSLGYGNNVSGSFTYDDHLKLSSLKYTSGSNTLLNLTYSYGTQNNGEITGITDSRGPAYSENFTFDPLARLAVAQTADLSAANTWCLKWVFDRSGNRRSQSACGGTTSVGQPQLTIDPTTNRITNSGFAYDANGNLTNDGIHTYKYDAENRIVQVDNGSTAVYTYDGHGLRVSKGNTTYVRSGAQIIAEYNGSTVQREYVYSPEGVLIESVSAGSGTYYQRDHLSNRLLTDSTGNVLGTNGSLPFGDSWYSTQISDKWQFATYERDSETGLDYALARYYSSRLGRFMSPDPLAGMPENPQSLNRYTYSRNDPVNLVDPLGLTVVTATTCSYGIVEVPDGPPDDPSSHEEIGLVCEQTLIDVPDGPPERPPDPPVPPNPCDQKIIDAINKKLGTNLTASNITGHGKQDNTAGRGSQWNINVGANSWNDGLTANQFNAIQPDTHFPMSTTAAVVGWGSTLHIAGTGFFQHFFDPSATFSSSNIGGQLSVNFTAHLDSANGGNPLGAIMHFFRDVLFHKHRNPCP